MVKEAWAFFLVQIITAKIITTVRYFRVDTDAFFMPAKFVFIGIKIYTRIKTKAAFSADFKTIN